MHGGDPFDNAGETGNGADGGAPVDDIDDDSSEASEPVRAASASAVLTLQTTRQRHNRAHAQQRGYEPDLTNLVRLLVALGATVALGAHGYILVCPWLVYSCFR